MRQVVLGIVCSLVIFISSCAKNEFVKNDKILNIPLTTEVSSLDPVSSFDNVSNSIIYNVCEQLYEYHYLNTPYELKPLLAADMPKIENNGQRYIIKLKKNIQYHDHPAFGGKPRFMKAQDFIVAFKRLAYKPYKSTGWWVADGFIVGINEFREAVDEDFEKFKKQEIKGIYARDEHTLVIELVKPSPQFIYKLSLSFISPYPEELLGGEYEESQKSKPIGTGPFYVEKFDPKKEITLLKNKNYHENYYPSEGDRIANSRGYLKDAGEKIPFIDEVHFHVVPDNQTRWDMFMNHKIDFIVLPRDFYTRVFDDVGNLKEEIKSNNVRLQTMPTLTFWWLTFNMQDPVWGKNVNLRKAIAHAIDMDKYIRDFTVNTGQKANSILPPGVFGYDTNSTLPYTYDLTKAREYLVKAGYPEGKGLPPLRFDSRSLAQTSLQQTAFFKQQLGQIGIKVEIVQNEFTKFLEKARTGSLQMFQDGWTLDYPDAENVFQLLVSTNTPPGTNVTYYNNKEYDALYEKMAALPDGPEKKKIVKQLEAIVYNDVPWIIQYYSRNFILYHDYLKNYRPSDLIWSYPKYIKIKQ